MHLELVFFLFYFYMISNYCFLNITPPCSLSIWICPEIIIMDDASEKEKKSAEQNEKDQVDKS